MPMRVHVRLFAVLRDTAGVGETSVQLDGPSDVFAATEVLAAKFPTIRALLPRVAFAVNRQYVKPDAPLQDGDELALIPPVSGG